MPFQRLPESVQTLGAALLDRLFELRWIERTDRAVRLSDQGGSDLRRHLGIEVP